MMSSVWILLLACLSTGRTSKGQAAPGAAYQMVAPQVLEDSTLKETICIDPDRIASGSCTVMKRGKLYKIFKEKIPEYSQYGMSIVSEYFPDTAFIGKPIYFCCDNEVIATALIDPRKIYKWWDEREFNSVKLWSRRYKALRKAPYYDKFKNHMNFGVDKDSKEALDKIRKAKTSTEKKGDQELIKALQIVDDIRFNELDVRLSKAKIIEEERSDVW